TQPATGETYPKSDLFNKAQAILWQEVLCVKILFMQVFPVSLLKKFHRDKLYVKENVFFAFYSKRV
ncbi:MAG: hypothetical protein ACLTFW_03740, partial [Klebsiella pneumoniae]